MGLRDMLRSLDRYAMAGYGQRMLTPTMLWGTGNEALMMGRTATGRRVDLETALTLPVVQRAFSLMVGNISTLPIDTYRRVGDQRIEMPAPPWVELPDAGNPNKRRPQFVGQCVTSLMGDGNLFIRAFPDRFSPSVIRVIDPAYVSIKTDSNGIDAYRVGSAMLSAAEIVHIPWLVSPGRSRGHSPIILLQESIASGLAAMEFGGYFFANGAAMQGIVEVPQGVQVDADELKKQLQRGNQGVTKSHAFGVLTGGSHFVELTRNPRDSQMVELQKFIVEDVGRAFGIPPYLLGSQEPGAVAYASTSNARVDYVKNAVQPIVSVIENALSTLIPGDDTFLRFNIDALLRGDILARFQALHIAAQDGVVSKDEWRALEDMGPADQALGVGTDFGGFLQTPNNTSPNDQPVPTPVMPEPMAVQPARSDPVSITVHSPPVNVTTFQTPDSTDAERAADLMVADQRDRLGLMEVTVAEAHQQTRDYVAERMADVEARLVAAETQRTADLERITAIPSVVREVTMRDELGRVLTVIERRGDRTVRKMIERDESGQIVRVTEVAA